MCQRKHGETEMKKRIIDRSRLSHMLAAAFLGLMMAAVAGVHAHPHGSPGGTGGSPPGGGGSGGGSGGTGDGGGPGDPGTCGMGKPVSMFTGREMHEDEDIVVNGIYPIMIVRKYDSQTDYDSPLGYGWAFKGYDKRLFKYPDGSVVLRRGCGIRDLYLISGGAYQPPAGVFNQLEERADGTFVVRYASKHVDEFDIYGRLIRRINPQGQWHTLTYDSRGRLPLVGVSPYSLDPGKPMPIAYDYRLARVEEHKLDGSVSGAWVVFDYNEATGRISRLRASDGREIQYLHDSSNTLRNGNLVEVHGLEGRRSTYEYNDSRDYHNVTRIQTAQDALPYVNTYNANDQVIKQAHGRNSYSFTYGLYPAATHTIRNAANQVIHTLITRTEFNDQGYITRVTRLLAGNYQIIKRYERNDQMLVERKTISEKRGNAAEQRMQTIEYDYNTAGDETEQRILLAGGEVITRLRRYESHWLSSEEWVSSATPAKRFRTDYLFNYDAQGHPLNIREWRRYLDATRMQITAYAYDAQGRKQRTTYPDGHRVHHVYDGLYLSKVYHDNGSGGESPYLKEEYGHDSQGNRDRVTDANNHATHNLFDARRRIVRITHATGEEDHLTYTGEYLTQIETGRTAAAGEGQVVRYSYSPEGWLEKTARKADDGSWLTILALTHDSRGKVLSRADAAGRTTTYRYDALGQLVRVTDPQGHAQHYAYDALGNRTTITNAKGQVTHNSYDARNRLIKTEQRGVSPAVEIAYAYDAKDNLLRVTDGEGQTTRYEYDGLSRKRKEIRPLGQELQYAYDNRDRLDYQHNARGQKTDYIYAAWGGLTHIEYFSSASSTTPERVITYSRTLTGNSSQITDSSLPGFRYAYTYDTRDRLDLEYTHGLGPIDRYLDHDYDRYGNRQAVTLYQRVGDDWQQQYQHRYQYNKLGRLVQAQLLSPTPHSFDYYDTDELQRVRHPNGVSSGYTYWPDGAIRQIQLTGTSASIEQFDYTYDANDNIETWQTQTGVHSYSYDGLDRLNTADHPVGTGLPAEEAFAYDQVGNREDPADSSLYDYDGNNRILQSPGLTYSFDPDGNQTGRSDGASFVHDVGNRLQEYHKDSTTALYRYDAAGRRIKKTVLDGSGEKTVYYHWDGDVLFAEYDQNGALIRRYAYYPGQHAPLEMADANGVYAVHVDHLQTPKRLTDATQQSVWQSWHQAFGQAQVNEDVDGNGVGVAFYQRFPGQYYDSETGLHYNWNRFVDPATGRFLTSDAIGLAGGLNTYLYANANPIRYFDPNGESATATWGGLGAAGEGATGAGARGGLGALGPIGAVAGAGLGGYWLGGLFYPYIAEPLGDAIDNICRDESTEEACDKQYYEVDIPTCRAISKSRGKAAGARCYADAADRYAECLKGSPLPPLDTWNN